MNLTADYSKGVSLRVITNAAASLQPSMIGYGSLLVREMQGAGIKCKETRGSSLLSALTSKGRTGQFLRTIDRFCATPFLCAGQRSAVLHAVDPGNAIYMPLARASAWSVTVHDMVPYLAAKGEIAGFRPSRTGRFLMREIQNILRRANGIIAVSETTRQDLIRIANIDASRITVIHNALFQRIERVTEEKCISFRARHRLPSAGPLILNIGRNFYKNRLFVVDIFARVARERSDAHLVFVSSPSSEITDAITRAGISSRVSFVPHVNPEDISACYSAASLLLFPSVYEGFGYPVLEAQMTGTPVICSDAGSLPEIAGNGAIVHELSDPAGMAKSALEILDNSHLVADLVSRGFKNAERFTISRWRNSYASYFRQLVEEEQ